jgi:predicted enzyme related to lactoylglutathione lyase
MSNALNWFEIPVTDLARAREFYGRVLQAELREETMGGTSMAIFPYQDGGVGGALIVGEHHVPGATGALVYLNAGDDLGGALRRVEEAGGKVVMGATPLPGTIGSIAIFLDSEGNRTALHSPPQGA